MLMGFPGSWKAGPVGNTLTGWPLDTSLSGHVTLGRSIPLLNLFSKRLKGAAEKCTGKGLFLLSEGDQGWVGLPAKVLGSPLPSE